MAIVREAATPRNESRGKPLAAFESSICTRKIESLVLSSATAGLADQELRSLAARARLIGRRLEPELATILTPETLLRWHRQLIATSYDGSARRCTGRPARDCGVEWRCLKMDDFLMSPDPAVWN
jgi:hypothetical protein